MLVRWMDLEPVRSLGSHKGVRAENMWDTEIFGGDLVLLYVLKLKFMKNEDIPKQIPWFVYCPIVSPKGPL